jgi:group I intron endonuclease
LRTDTKQVYTAELIKLTEKHILVPSPPPPGERGGGLSEAGCSAAAVNLSRRLAYYYSKKHMETSLKKGKSAIYSSIINYGLSNFKLEILESCSGFAAKKCVKLEQIYLDFFKPEYNILKISGSSLGVICSEETRAKISASNLGKTRSEVTRAKMSASQMGNTNGQNHPNSIKIQVTDLELNTKTIYKSMRAAARALNIRQSSISKYFIKNREKPFKGRYIFSRVLD